MPVYGKASTLNYKSLDQDLNYQLLELDLLVNTSEKITDQTISHSRFSPMDSSKKTLEGMNQYWNEFLLDIM